jgi:hypothetical protein
LFCINYKVNIENSTLTQIRNTRKDCSGSWGGRQALF